MTKFSPQRPVAHSPQIAATLYLSAVAVAEGWDVVDCGTREDGSAHLELQRLDRPEHGEPVFQDDAAAWSISSRERGRAPPFISVPCK